MKIVINSCFGGFLLSDAALSKYEEIAGSPAPNGMDIKRDDPVLVKVVELLGSDAERGPAELKVVEIPDDVEWQIEEYDGMEWIAEKHRTWA